MSTILGILWVYDMSVLNFSNPEGITAAPWTICGCIAIQAVIGAIVQSFFAYRIWKVSNALILPSLAWAGAVVRIGINICLSVLLSRAGNVIVFSDNYNGVVIASFAVPLATDILNLSALIWYLTQIKSQNQKYVSVSSMPIAYVD